MAGSPLSPAISGVARDKHLSFLSVDLTVSPVSRGGGPLYWTGTRLTSGMRQLHPPTQPRLPVTVCVRVATQITNPPSDPISAGTCDRDSPPDAYRHRRTSAMRKPPHRPHRYSDRSAAYTQQLLRRQRPYPAPDAMAVEHPRPASIATSLELTAFMVGALAGWYHHRRELPSGAY